MNVCHALNCVRDNGAEMLKLAFSHVSSEPVFRAAEGLYTPALIADLKIVGLRESGRTAF